METKRTAMAWWFLVVMTTTFLVTANPVVNPGPTTEKEKISSAVKNNKPANQQLPQGLTSAKMPKVPGRMQSQGKASKTIMTVDSNQANLDPRPTETDPPLAPSRSFPAADKTPPSGQKNAAPPGERGKQRGRPPPNVPGIAGLSRGGAGRLGIGGGGATEGKVRGGGKGGGREEAGGMTGTGSDAVRLKQLKGPPSKDDASLLYLMTGPVDNDGRQNGGQQQPSSARGGSEDLRGSSSVDRLSSFALNDVPPLAMAEYLMLTGDFNGLDDALADIVAIGMMAPEEAEVYRDTVRLEYDSLLRQEAAADNEYQEADDVLRGGVQPFLPPLAIEYPDYSYYGNQALDNGRGGPFNPIGLYGPSRQGDKLEEVLQQMLDSIASSYNVPGSEDNGSDDSSAGGKTSSSSSSSSSSSTTTLEDQLKSLDQPAEKQTKGKTGGQKGGGGKGGAGKGKGGGGGGGKGGGGGGKGKGRKQDAKLPDAEKELKLVASHVPQNKTKEANSTKSRRPLSKEEASP